VDRHIRDGALRSQTLHRNQHAYQIGKSTETALRNVVTRVERAIEHKDIALGQGSATCGSRATCGSLDVKLRLFSSILE
jgi:hypothetical protein